MQFFPLPRRGAVRQIAAGLMSVAMIGLAACGKDSSDLGTGPNLPEDPGSNPQLGQAAFVFDVNVRTGTVHVTNPQVKLDLSKAQLGKGTYALNASVARGPDFSILSNDAISVSTSNFFASQVGAIAPNKVRVYFDVQVSNLLPGVDLITPNFPTPPAGQNGLVLFPFSTNVTVTSGGVGVEDGNNVVVELPSHGEVQPSIDWNGNASLDKATFPGVPGTGGTPHNFFNDANCASGNPPEAPSDCYRYETFGSIPSGAISVARRVGFDIDASVGEFRARLIAAADLQPTGSGSTGTVSGQITSPQRGALQGVTVTVQGVPATQTSDVSGNYTFTGVGLGSRTVTLSNLPSGCTTITPLNGQSVTVVGGGTATQNYSVTCTALAGTVSGSLSRTGTGSQSLAGITFTIDPDASGAATVNGTVSGGGASANYSATVSVGLGAGAGAGVITFGNLPAGCSISATVTYSGLTSGGTASGSPEPVTVTCTAAAPVTRYVYKSTWGTPSGGTVDLAITFDPSGFNNPAPELNGAAADAIGGAQALTQLSGTNVSRLTAVSAVATANFGSATLGGTLPTTSWLANTTSAGGFTTVQEIARLRYTIGAGGAASIGTTTTLSEVSTPNGDPFNLIFSGANQNVDVIEAGTAGSPALVLP